MDAKGAYDEMHGFKFGPDGDKLSIEVRVDSLVLFLHIMLSFLSQSTN